MPDTAARVAVLAVIGLVLTAGSAGAVGGGPPGQVDIETDSTTLNVALESDGDADWAVVYRIRLDDENATAAFEDLRADVAANTTDYLGPFEQRMQRTVSAAENATGRTMGVENVTVETRTESQPQATYGVLTYRFEWTNFATAEDGQLRAGDAIDQLFLEADSSLRIRWPEGYGLESQTPEPTRTGDREVVWEGGREFDAGEPRVVVSEGAGGSPDGSGIWPGIVLVGTALVLGAGVWLFARRNGAGPLEDGAETDDDGAPDEDEDGPPPELLSNEERVLQLLEEEGGRMKQKQVAEELDWTAAKTSQVVGTLRDEEELDSFRLGRENVLTLPDVEIDPGADEE